MRGVPSQPRRDPRRSPRVTRPLPAGGAARSPAAAPPRSGRARPAPAGAVRGGSRCVGRADIPHGPPPPVRGVGGFPSSSPSNPRCNAAPGEPPPPGGRLRDETPPSVYFTVVPPHPCAHSWGPTVHPVPHRVPPAPRLARLKVQRRKAEGHSRSSSPSPIPKFLPGPSPSQQPGQALPTQAARHSPACKNSRFSHCQHAKMRGMRLSHPWEGWGVPAPTRCWKHQ